MAQHGVEFVQFACAATQLLDVDAGRLGQFLELGVAMRQELVQRRVEQADRAWQARHDLEDGDEVAALFGQQLVERGATAGLGIGENHFAHRADAAGIEEHVLGAAQADALGPELARHAAFGLGLGIGAHTHPAVLVGPFHQRAEIARQLGLDRGDLARHDLPVRTVDGDDIAFLELAVADREHAALARDRHLRRARHAGAAHAARHHCGVAGHPATRGEDAGGGMHAVNILGAGLDAYEDHLLAAIGPQFCGVGIEHDFAACRTGRRGQASGQHIARRIGIERRMQQLVERHRVDAQDRGLFIDQALTHHVDRHLERGLSGPLAVARLQQPQRALLHGELDVLHIGVMLLEQLEHAR